MATLDIRLNISGLPATVVPEVGKKINGVVVWNSCSSSAMFPGFNYLGSVPKMVAGERVQIYLRAGTILAERLYIDKPYTDLTADFKPVYPASAIDPQLNPFPKIASGRMSGFRYNNGLTAQLAIGFATDPSATGVDVTIRRAATNTSGFVQQGKLSTAVADANFPQLVNFNDIAPGDYQLTYKEAGVNQSPVVISFTVNSNYTTNVSAFNYTTGTVLDDNSSEVVYATIRRAAAHWDGNNSSITVKFDATADIDVDYIVNGKSFYNGLYFNVSQSDTEGYKIATNATIGFSAPITVKFRERGKLTWITRTVTPPLSADYVQIYSSSTPAPAPTPSPTPTPAPTTGTIYNRVLYVGNSITLHGGSNFFLVNAQNPKRGMAATAPDKDYVRVLSAKHRAVNSTVDNRTLAADAWYQGGTLDEATGPYVEGELTKANFIDLSRFNPVASWKPDLVYIRLGENVTDQDIPTIGDTEIKRRLKELIDKLISQNPTAKVVLSTSVWDKPNYDRCIRAVAVERAYPIADFSAMWPGRNTNNYYAFSEYTDPGTAMHPNDNGMVHIADTLYSVTERTTAVTVPTPVNDTFNYPTVIGLGTWPENNPAINRGKAVGPVYRFNTPNIMVEIRPTYGGAIQITDKITGRALINNHDWGRSSEITVYGGPKNFAALKPGEPGRQWSDIGWNPILVGNYKDVPSPVDAWGIVRGNDNNDWLYTKTHLISWPSGAVGDAFNPPVLLECWVERWIRVVGKEVDIRARTTFDRNDQTWYGTENVSPQEYPNFIASSNQTESIYYTGNAPYTNGPVTRTNTRETANVSFQQTTFNVSEPWIAVKYNGTNTHTFINTDKFGQVATALYVPSQADTDEFADAATYTSPSNLLIVDPKAVWYHRYAFFVTDNFDEGRAWANAKPRKYGDVPNFIFNRVNGRCDWVIDKGQDQKEPFVSDNWRCRMIPSADGGAATARRSSLASPIVTHKANQIQNLYLRMRYTGSETAFNIEYIRNGQRNRGLDSDKPNEMSARYPNGAANGGTQVLRVNGVIGDGQLRTYTIPTGGSEWKDIIQQYFLKYVAGGTIPNEETLEMVYFSSTNLG